MAGMAVFNVIGTLLGIGLMIPGLIPDKDEHQTIVRIGAGLSIDESASTSGDKPGVHLYDVMGRSIGSTGGSKHDKILDGDFMDISVPFDSGVGKKPTEYLSVANGGDDALCIAYIAVTQPDGTKKAWYGDVAKSCGADWYHSQLKTGDDDYQPACIWIDRDRSYGLRFQGLGIHINDFAATKERAQQYNQNHDLMCKAAPRLRMYTDMNDDDPIPFFSPPLEYNATGLVDADPAVVLNKKHWSLPNPGPNIKKSVVDADQAPYHPHSRRLRHRAQRQGIQPPSPFDGKLILSNSTHHSAKRLCESPTSAGPDFVSLAERSFCDMSVKKLWPFCGGGAGGKTTACFDQKNHTVVVGSVVGNGTRFHGVAKEMVALDAAVTVPKSYSTTIHWS